MRQIIVIPDANDLKPDQRQYFENFLYRLTLAIDHEDLTCEIQIAWSYGAVDETLKAEKSRMIDRAQLARELYRELVVLGLQSGNSLQPEQAILAAFTRLDAERQDQQATTASLCDLYKNSFHHLLEHVRTMAVIVGDATNEDAKAISADYAPALVSLVRFLAEKPAERQDATDLADLAQAPVSYATPADHYREMARRLAESRDELKHRCRALEGEIAQLQQELTDSEHRFGDACALRAWAEVRLQDATSTSAQDNSRAAQSRRDTERPYDGLAEKQVTQAHDRAASERTSDQQSVDETIAEREAAIRQEERQREHERFSLIKEACHTTALSDFAKIVAIDSIVTSREPLTPEDIARTQELARKYGWEAALPLPVPPPPQEPAE